MKDSLSRELRYLFPAWLGCVLLPLPAIVFWVSDDGRSLALLLFSVGCASLVAYAFRRDINHRIPDDPEHPEQTWHKRMTATGVALFAAFVAFSLLCLTLNDAQDFVAVFLAFLVLIPSLCVVPFLTLVTRRPVAAVVFALFIVFCMKLLGGIVVVLVYGWSADRHGYTDMPWTHPNLLVWLFWLNTGVLSLSLYLLGARRFQEGYDRAA
jgi:UDP-N-acetylmuramyl pentapeptide phosphotransferase/UDP-N-acetylglucosamine-1-phosphate transferase